MDKISRKEKIVILTLSLVILNLAVFTILMLYFDKKIADIYGSNRAESNGSSFNLTDAAGKGLLLIYKEKEFTVEPQQIQTWVEGYARSYTGSREYRINREAISAHLQKIADQINKAPVNARLVLNNGKVAEFVPAKSGAVLNIRASADNLVLALISGAGSSSNQSLGRLVVNEVKPEVTLENVNTLGINTLLARGESNFGGSPKSRTHNIEAAAKTFNGIVLKPGEEFSFIKFLGNVDASTGYLPELIIKSGKLIPEYGGGVCQVSTTLFRAVAAAGLPILERHPHSIPVRYYNPQGFDATIYPGVADLRFKNDTSAHILIQSKIEGSKLYFEIYGTSDNRKVSLNGPRQYDIGSDGAMKAVLSRTVTYPDGTEKKDVFRSSYKSPSSFQVVRNPLE